MVAIEPDNVLEYNEMFYLTITIPMGSALEGCARLDSPSMAEVIVKDRKNIWKRNEKFLPRDEKWLLITHHFNYLAIKWMRNSENDFIRSLHTMHWIWNWVRWYITTCSFTGYYDEVLLKVKLCFKETTLRIWISFHRNLTSSIAEVYQIHYLTHAKGFGVKPRG